MVIRTKRTNKTRWVITSLNNERGTVVLAERPSGNRLFLISAEQHAVRAVNWNRYNCDFNAKLCERYSYFILYCRLYPRYCTRDRVYINKKKNMYKYKINQRVAYIIKFMYSCFVLITFYYVVVAVEHAHTLVILTRG